MVHGAQFFAKFKKPYFGGVFGHYSQNEIFPQKPGSVSCFPLRHPNFMRSSRKILSAVLEKTCLLTDILTLVESLDAFSPKGWGPKIIMSCFREKLLKMDTQADEIVN